jgi:hypothetical protein
MRRGVGRAPRPRRRRQAPARAPHGELAVREDVLVAERLELVELRERARREEDPAAPGPGARGGGGPGRGEAEVAGWVAGGVGR